jgi:hypothetical protein
MKTKILFRWLLVPILAGASIAPVQAQTTPAPQPSICTRSCWTARSGTCTTTMSALTRAIIHHTASSGDWSTTSLSASAAQMRSHQNYHMDANGWCDLGYHFTVDKLGNIFEGRKNSMTSLIKGTHAGCGNTDTFGFTFLGYCHSPYNHNPPVVMRSAIYDVIAWRMPSGWTPYGGRTSYSGSLNGTAAKIDTHRWVGANSGSGCTYTSCPGDYVVQYITDNFSGGEMRTGVANRRSPAPADIPVKGDWDGNGTVTPGVMRGNIWMLRNSNSGGSAEIEFSFGTTGDIPVTGDWDGNGTTTIGIFRPSDRTWHLRNSNSGGSVSYTAFSFGTAGDMPITGDWDGNGTTTIGIYRPSDRTFHLRNANSSGSVSYTAFAWGIAGDMPIVGDWDGNGTTTIGVYRPSDRTFNMRNANSGGAASYSFAYGIAGDMPVTGDWDGNGTTTIGVFRPSDAYWYLRNAHSGGTANYSFKYGQEQ